MKHYWYYTCTIQQQKETIKAHGYATSNNYFPIARIFKYIMSEYPVTSDDIIITSAIEVSKEDYGELHDIIK